MKKQKFRVYVIVPVYNESKNILSVINNIPSVVDEIVIIDDKSTDKTLKILLSKKNTQLKKCKILTHDKNIGQGAARATGFKYLINRSNNKISKNSRNKRFPNKVEREDDLFIVLDGDGQMDPKEIELFIKTRIKTNAQFIKGDRFETPNLLQIMPNIRIIGNIILSLMTKIASGYWFLSDSQCGYFTFTREAAKKIDWDKLVKGYGQINELIILSSMKNITAATVYVKAIYGIGEVSGIKIRKVWISILKICLKGFLKRIIIKNIIWQTQPFAFFYLGSLISFIVFIYFLTSSILFKIENSVFPPLSTTITMFLFLITSLSFVQGLIFDLNHNEKYDYSN